MLCGLCIVIWGVYCYVDCVLVLGVYIGTWIVYCYIAGYIGRWGV